MRMLSFLTKTLVFLLLFFPLLGLAIKNMDSITVRYFFDLEWQLPLAFVLLVMFAVGIMAGILPSLGVIARQRLELRSIRRELHAKRRAAVPVEAA